MFPNRSQAANRARRILAQNEEARVNDEIDNTRRAMQRLEHQLAHLVVSDATLEAVLELEDALRALRGRIESG